jgi:hypothetical protein
MSKTVPPLEPRLLANRIVPSGEKLGVPSGCAVDVSCF